MSRKNIQVWLPFLLSLTLITGMFFGYKLKDTMGQYGPAFPGRQKQTTLQEILELVRSRYVDSVNVDTLGQMAITNVLSQLDPHSVYINAAELRNVSNELKGNFEGIGVEFELLDDTVTVLNLFPKGPAETAGLQVGDQLLQANDSLVSGVKASSDKVRSLFIGPRGTSVRIRLLRHGAPLTVSIQRGVIPVRSVDAAYLLEPGIGFIRLNKFSSTTYEEFMQHLERLKKEGMQHLVLDLRDNGGGILDDAIQIADEFLGGSREIVYTEGKSVPRQIYTARRPGLLEEGKLVVLINEGSASASEVLAGALQDWDRATIIGRRSFGKGLVQEQFYLSDGSAIRLTVSRYFTPVGRSIQKPYQKGNGAAYDHEVSDRYQNGEMLHAGGAVPQGTPYKTKGGRTVYGGGGIMPDQYVAMDSAEFAFFKGNRFPRRLLAKTAFSYFMLTRDTLTQFKNAPELAAFLEADNRLAASLQRNLAADTSGVFSYTVQQQQLLLRQVRSLVARQLWRREGYHKMNNLSDPMIARALELIR
ncbi:MAG TPA: S41 family peptidase [Lacibacter sp.]|nr:S41 family peptidase [Lacibacter sp.]